MSLPAAFISVILIWSTAPLAIKWSTLGIDPGFAVFSRMMIGALLCAVLLALLRVRFWACSVRCSVSHCITT